MKGIDILISPPVAFVLFLIIAFLLTLLGKRMAPRLTKAGGKLTTYACGEDIPGVKVQFGYRLFFFVALFFTIMHVATLMIATVPSGKIAWFAVLYLAVIFLSIMALVTRSGNA
jgi:NADH-quinone oxidoreductase subunit A